MKLKIKSAVVKVQELIEVSDLYGTSLSYDDADKWFDEIGLKGTTIKDEFIRKSVAPKNIQYSRVQEASDVLNDELAIRFFILWLFSKSGGPVEIIKTIIKKPDLVSEGNKLYNNLDQTKLDSLKQVGDPKGFFDNLYSFISKNIGKWSAYSNSNMTQEVLDDLNRIKNECFEQMKNSLDAGEINQEYIDKCKIDYIPKLNEIIDFLKTYISTIQIKTETMTYYDSDAYRKLETEKEGELKSITEKQNAEIALLPSLSESKNEDLKPLKQKYNEIVKESNSPNASKEPEKVAEYEQSKTQLKNEIQKILEKYKEKEKEIKEKEKEIQARYAKEIGPINEKYENLKKDLEVLNPDALGGPVITVPKEEKITLNLSSAVFNWKQTKSFMSDPQGQIRKIVATAKWNSFIKSFGTLNSKVLRLLVRKDEDISLTNKNLFNYLYFNESVRYNKPNKDNIFTKSNFENLDFKTCDIHEFGGIIDWVSSNERSDATTIRYYRGRPLTPRDRKNVCNNPACQNFNNYFKATPLPDDFFLPNDSINEAYDQNGQIILDSCLECNQVGRLMYPRGSAEVPFTNGPMAMFQGFPLGLAMFNHTKHRQTIQLDPPRTVCVNGVNQFLSEVNCTEFSKPTSHELESMVNDYTWLDMRLAEQNYHNWLNRRPNREGERELASLTQDYVERKEVVLPFDNRTRDRINDLSGSEKLSGGYGWYWADLNTGTIDDEEKIRAGHCGRAMSMDGLFSLRVCTPDYSRKSTRGYNPWVNHTKATISLNKKGYLCQIKCPGNTRPDTRELWEKLVSLISTELLIPMNSTVLPFTVLKPINQIRKLLNGTEVDLANYAKPTLIQPIFEYAINPGFLRTDYTRQGVEGSCDFHIIDLPDDLLKKLYELRPDFFEYSTKFVEKSAEAEAILKRLGNIFIAEKEAEKERLKAEKEAEKERKMEENTGN